MITIAVDPGSAGKGLAVAHFFDKRLTDVYFARPHDFARRLSSGNVVDARVVIEKPQADRRAEDVSPKSLISLSWAGGIAVGACLSQYPEARLTEATPNAWKGSETKPHQHRRLWLMLGPQERLLLGGADTWRAIDVACDRGALNRWKRPGASYYGKNDVHNLLDAAALGAWAVGRLRKP